METDRILTEADAPRSPGSVCVATIMFHKGSALFRQRRGFRFAPLLKRLRARETAGPPDPRGHVGFSETPLGW